MDAVETIEIENPKKAGEKWVINKADYDPEKHKLWVEPAEGAAKETPKSTLPKPERK